MFKHYLSYHLVLSFEQSCRALDLPDRALAELMSSARKVVVHFSTALQARDPKEQLRSFCVALLCLRDCKEVLDREGVSSFDVLGRYEVVHGRLEALSVQASDAENGQLRLIG